MTRRPPPTSKLLPGLALACVAAALAAGSGAARAEKADRSKPIVMEADRPGTLDYQRQVLVFNGNAVISQGSMVLRAERIELREMTDGYRAASAIGAPGKPASWRQRRDVADEVVEGTADRIEFDGRADSLRFVGNATVRRLRAGAVVDEINGASLLWDNGAEVFKVEGGAVTAANPTGRVRATFTPRAEPTAASAPAAVPPATLPLQPSRALSDKPGEKPGEKR